MIVGLHVCTICQDPELLFQTVQGVCSGVSVQVRVFAACLIHITDLHDLVGCSGQWMKCWKQL